MEVDRSSQRSSLLRPGVADGPSAPPLRGLLGMLIILAPWPAGPFLLLGSMITVGRPLGLLGVIGGIVLMVLALKAPSRPLQFAACAATFAWAAASPRETDGRLTAFAAAAFVTFMVYLCGIQQKPWPAFRSLVFDQKRFSPKNYFSQCEVRCDFKKVKDTKSFFAFHPHGIFSAGFTLNACFDSTFLAGVRNIQFLVDGTLRDKNPFFKVVLEWCTTPSTGWAAADKRTMTKLMSSGANIGLIPGGFQDATVFQYGRDRIVLNDRKGFVKYCLQYGYRIHPVYTFGESETFYAAQGALSFRLWLNGHGIPTVAPFGWSLLPFCPRPQAKLITVVGEALDLPLLADPTVKDVDEWHGKYMAALRKLFDEKKVEVGRPDAVLEVL